MVSFASRLIARFILVICLLALLLRLIWTETPPPAVNETREEYCHANGLCIHRQGSVDQYDDHGLCVLVRTYQGQEDQLKVQLLGWETIAHQASRDVHVFLINTDRAEDARAALSMFQRVDLQHTWSRVHWAMRPPTMVPDRKLYGYDTTQLLLDAVRHHFHNHCQSYIISNGDNYYHPELLQNTGLDGSQPRPYTPLVGFDFITHHERTDAEGRRKKIKKYKWKKKKKKAKTMSPNQRVISEFRRKMIDLGAAIIDRRAFDECPQARYERQAKQGDNFALDWVVFNKMIKECHQEHRVVHQVLFVHQ